MSDYNFQIGGGRSNPMSYGGERDSEKKEIRIQVPGRSGPMYDNLNLYFVQHIHLVATLGKDHSMVVDSRKRMAGNMAGQGMEWEAIKAKVQELFDRGKLKKWAATAAGAQAELEQCFKYFNAATLK